jgi:hypothetical protein
MNFISWNTKQIINENTQNYFSADIINESISKTLKPVMNKMQKLNIGVPYRDARVFFFRFLQDKYPDLIPAGFETRKPAGKDVNALVGEIAMENPELLDKFGPEFDAYSREEVPGGLDRVSQFLNTAATMRQGKGVRQTAAAAAQTGGIKKDYSKLTAQEIADATTDAIKKKEADFDAGDDVSDEKLLLKTAVSSILTKLNDEIHPDVLLNVAEAVSKIDTVAKFKEFLDYISELEEYRVIHQYLEDALDVIETNLADLQAQKEDEEYEQKENLVGMEAVLDNERSVIIVDHEPGTRFVFVQDEDSNEYKVPLSRLDFRVAPENGEHEQEEVSLEDAITLSHEEYEAVQNFQNFNPGEWQEKADGSGWERKAEKAEEDSTNRYMPNVSTYDRRPEEAEEVRMSQQQINQYLAVQERQRVQNLYAHQRRNTHGY